MKFRVASNVNEGMSRNDSCMASTFSMYHTNGEQARGEGVITCSRSAAASKPLQKYNWVWSRQEFVIDQSK